MWRDPITSMPLICVLCLLFLAFNSMFKIGYYNNLVTSELYMTWKYWLSDLSRNVLSQHQTTWRRVTPCPWAWNKWQTKRPHGRKKNKLKATTLADYEKIKRLRGGKWSATMLAVWGKGSPPSLLQKTCLLIRPSSRHWITTSWPCNRMHQSEIYVKEISPPGQSEFQGRPLRWPCASSRGWSAGPWKTVSHPATFNPKDMT